MAYYRRGRYGRRTYGRRRSYGRRTRTGGNGGLRRGQSGGRYRMSTRRFYYSGRYL